MALGQGPGSGVISYTTSDGLSDGTIKIIFEDSRGYLWFGTFNGGICTDGGGLNRNDRRTGR